MLRFRVFFQIGALLFYNSNYLFSYEYCPVPGLNCYACPIAGGACPLGSLQHFMVLRRIPFFLIGFFLLIGGLVGRMVCGWICPIGWLQELMYKAKVKKLRINYKPLRYLKYVVLASLVLIIPFLLGEPWFSKLCFVGTIQAGIPLIIMDQSLRDLIGTLFYIKLAITGVTLTAFLFIKRPFCRFICPLGATYSLFNPVSYARLEVGKGCYECDKCREICPVDIKVHEEPNSPECVRCLECTTCAHVELKMGRKKEGKPEEVEQYA